MNAEDRRIQKWIKGWPSEGILLGPGDDCALVSSPPAGSLAVLKTDALVQDVHFTLKDPAASVGHKALARPLSDFAAMGATPLAALVTVGLPSGTVGGAYTDGVMRGMGRTAKQFKISLAGGETTRSRTLFFSVSLYGHIEEALAKRRDTAKAGDFLFVTGQLGSTRARHHLTFTPRLEEGRWLAQKDTVTAMMDISDGIGADLPRLARLSQTSYEIKPGDLPLREGATPFSAVNDGEDFELLMAVSPEKVEPLLADWPFATPLTCIGQLLSKNTRPRTGGLRFRGHDHLLNKKPK